jgi:hypothetical protein
LLHAKDAELLQFATVLSCKAVVISASEAWKGATSPAHLHTVPRLDLVFEHFVDELVLLDAR